MERTLNLCLKRAFLKLTIETSVRNCKPNHDWNQQKLGISNFADRCLWMTMRRHTRNRMPHRERNENLLHDFHFPLVSEWQSRWNGNTNVHRNWQSFEWHSNVLQFQPNTLHDTCVQRQETCHSYYIPKCAQWNPLLDIYFFLSHIWHVTLHTHSHRTQSLCDYLQTKDKREMHSLKFMIMLHQSFVVPWRRSGAFNRKCPQIYCALRRRQ